MVDPNDLLTDAENRIVAEQLLHMNKDMRIRGVIQEYRDDNPEDARAEEFRKKIHEDYDGTVLREEVYPDPPERGAYGYARIDLKDGAIPQRQKPFNLMGERKEAFAEIVRQWEAHKFIERPTGPVEWLCQGFAVPIKYSTFPWRGVVDMRGVNSQTRRCNYPLPNI